MAHMALRQAGAALRSLAPSLKLGTASLLPSRNFSPLAEEGKETYTATLFPGDGIGPEIAEAVKQVSWADRIAHLDPTGIQRHSFLYVVSKIAMLDPFA